MPGLFSDGQKIQSAIIPLVLGESTRALDAADRLYAAGYHVPAIRYPTVPRDGARLRISISARHTKEQISGLCTALRAL
jgi:7-keto-8-aminopelargonate synthetase-like enzyme